MVNGSSNICRSLWRVPPDCLVRIKKNGTRRREQGRDEGGDRGLRSFCSIITVMTERSCEGGDWWSPGSTGGHSNSHRGDDWLSELEEHNRGCEVDWKEEEKQECCYSFGFTGTAPPMEDFDKQLKKKKGERWIESLSVWNEERFPATL
ncbi:unnamed protein product [Lactuca virosa]|uniref:Uncharacterized protein n=1 Tax=Lactuca virosa TaxID=75947 RepID=A0AAU9MMX4_9ASTR|nr:unnamed protein product [Lactuca virosa]